MKIVNSFEELIKELGLKPGDSIEIATPQFKREYDLEIKWKPQSVDEFNVVCNDLPHDVLRKMGVCVFDEGKKNILYLFPGEWFDLIPEGYPVIDISGHQEFWNKKTADDDIRYGCLSYGFYRYKK